MRAATLRIPALVATATGAAVAGALSAVWARPEERPAQISLTLVIAAYAITSVVILSARPGNRVARIMLLGTVAWGAGELLLGWGVLGWARTDPAVPGAAHAAVVGTAVRGAGWLLLVLGVPLTFPDGPTAWPGRRAPFALMGLSILALSFGCLLSPYPLEWRLQHLRSPTGLPDTLKAIADVLALSALILAFITLVLAVVGLRVKWRRADALGRQQLLWFSSAFALPLLCLPLVATPWASPWMFAAVSAPTPVALAVALLQRRLYDIELVMSRSLTYVLASVGAVAIYAGTVATVGLLLGRPGADWLPWVGAAVIALVFTPLRLGVRSIANRVTYGHWAAPADVLAATERRLRDATDLSRLLDAMVEELADLLRLPGLTVVNLQGRVVCRAGKVPGPGPGSTVSPATEELTLVAYGAPVGKMQWVRTPLRSSDRRLLVAVGRQLGEALHAAELVEELRRAQERLVLAREEERKRLRRDLHDGLGPSLAALGLEVDSLRNRIRVQHAHQTDTELVALRSGIQRTVAEVRRVVEGLRPAALDELGLGGALHQLVRRLTGAGFTTAASDVAAPVQADVRVSDLPDLPAATEVAAFRIAQEALTNAIRHADARRVSLSVIGEGRHLVVEVHDDGHGRLEPRDGGVGLSAMRERAEELGGSVDIDARPGAGTTVTARIPLTAHREAPVSARLTS